MSLVRPAWTVSLLALLIVLTGCFIAEASPPSYGKLPLSFEANQGQTDPSVAFVARSTGYQLFLTHDEAVLVLRRPGATSADTLRMALVDAAPARPQGVDRLPGAVNYLLGGEPANWRRAIPLYAKVRARDVYPGVDLVYYGNHRQLEYDFVVAPGADPAGIRMRFDGLVAQTPLVLEPSGDLTLRVPGGDVRLKRPVAYQDEANGRRTPVEVAFALVPSPDGARSHVGFRLGAYDRARPLVIDPVLSYATYLGETDVDAGMAIAVRNGEAYITGYTESLTFPPAGVQPDQPLRDAFVAKLNAAGSGLVYATYLGGDGADAGMGIAVDGSGQAYVTGFTESSDFPTVGALFGNQGGRDAFVTKLSADGTTFVFSTYLGGGLDDTALGIAVDATGNVYVTGWTDSTDFPTTASALQTDQPGRDAFVTKLDTSGTTLLYSTYVGGSGADEGHAITVDTSGFAYVAGDTTSTNMPTSANTRTHGGGQDAFVAKLNPGASGVASRVYLSYFGGSGTDAGRGVAVDSLGSILVTGATASTDLPAKSAYQTTYGGGGQDAFFARFNPAGTGPNQALQYSSYFGGSGDDAANAIAVDSDDQASITGSTTSANFPTKHGIGTGLGGAKDGFVAKFDPLVAGLPSLRYSTYLGGTGEDEAYGIAVDAAGSAYVVGLTRSGDFPGAIGSLSGPEDAFVAKLGEPDLEVPVFTVPATGGEGQVIKVTDTTRNKGIVVAAATTTAFYLSTDNKLDPGDTFLGSRPVPELDPNEESTADTDLTLPTPLPPGTYFLFAKADDEDAIGESFEGNNRARKTIVIGADLSVTVLSASTNGLTVTVTDTTKNVGGSVVAVSTTTKFFLSSASGEVFLGSRTVGPLDAGAESAASTDFQIPANTTGGSYTLIARADADGAVTETSETNNEKTTPFAVGVDLIVSALTVPGSAAAGASISVTPTIQNRGAIKSTPSTTEFFLSTSSTLDGTAVSIGTQPAPELAPGATSAVAASVTIPSTTTAGSYFIIAKANNVNPIAETNTNNNTRSRTSVVGPDLTVSFLSAPATTGPGKTITVKDTTKNVGAGNAAASLTKFYLSTNNTWEPSDPELGERAVPALTAGTDHFNTNGVSLTIPATTTAGSYFIIARANAGPTPIGEANTTNNTASAALELAGADLVVSSLTVTFSGASSVAITDITKNQGTSTAGASVTRYHFSTDATFDEATDPVLGERAVGQLLAGAQSEATNTFPLPAGTAAGSYTIFARADATGVVTESDESNNRRSRLIDTRGSDLIISSLSFSFGSGATLNISDTTRNEGPSTAGTSVTRFYLSTDTTVGAGDVTLGSRTIGSLAATNQSTVTTPVTIPATVVAGDYFLIARADDANAVGEVNEDNNTASKPISLRPDLVVDALNLPSAASVDAPITVTGTIRNGGPIPAPASVLKLYVSADATFDDTDTVVGTVGINALGADKTQDFSASVTLPANTSGGVFIIARIDPDNVITESNEGNNARSKALPVGPDLVISAFSGVPTAIAAGTAFTVNDTTKNQAAATSLASVTRFYLSTDNVWDPADVQLGSRPVPALGARKTSAGTTPITIPPTTAPGSYFLIAVADADGGNAEGVENNNTAVAPIVIGPDLVVSSLEATLKPGSVATITVKDTTANQGGAPASVVTTTRFYLSTNTTYEPGDVLLGSRVVNTLNPNASSSLSTDIVIPSGTTPGTYFVLARADADGAVAEVDETNNTRASAALVIGIDLIVSALSVPATGAPNANISVSNTITNLGVAQAGEFVVKLFLSTDAVLDPNDVPLGSRTVNSLAAAGSNQANTSVTIPANATNGAFFVIAQVDANGQVTEVNESNNTASAQLKIGPDLRVTVLNVTAEAGSGGVINIKDTTKNEGTLAGQSVTRFYLSTDDVLDVNVDTIIASRTVPELGPGASSSSNFDVTLPSGIQAGAYFVIALADATNVVAEAAEDNNTRSRPVTVGPDYVVSGLTAPAEGGAGLPITISISTKNQAASGVGQTVTEVYLATDRTLAGTNYLIGTRQIPQLNAGVTNTGQMTVTLPEGVAPGHYFIVGKANGNGAVTEVDTTNNLKDRAIIIGPDLVISNLTVPSPVGAGLVFTINDTVRNEKAGGTPTSTTSYFLSKDPVLDGSDLPIGSRTVPPLGPGASHTIDTPLTIPVGTPDGTYFLIARANEPSSVAELDTTNNEKSKTIKVGPDLVVSTLTAPTTATAGTTITVNDTTTNLGPGGAASFTVTLYLSANEVLEPATDLVVGSRTITGLAAGVASPGSFSVQIPSGLSGTFSLIAVADVDNAITEIQEANNQRQKTIKIVLPTP